MYTFDERDSSRDATYILIVTGTQIYLYQVAENTVERSSKNTSYEVVN